jgi:hypothetical protein
VFVVVLLCCCEPAAAEMFARVDRPTDRPVNAIAVPVPSGRRRELSFVAVVVVVVESLS